MHGCRRGQGEGARWHRAIRKREDAEKGGQERPLAGTGGRPRTAAGGDKERWRDGIAPYRTRKGSHRWLLTRTLRAAIHGCRLGQEGGQGWPLAGTRREGAMASRHTGQKERTDGGWVMMETKKGGGLDGCPLSCYGVWMDFWWGEMWIWLGWMVGWGRPWRS